MKWVADLQQMKNNGEKIAILTAYDASFARLLSDNGVDAILVGDTLGVVFQGNPYTVGVSIDEIVYHVAAVARGNNGALVIGDLPYMTYTNPQQAIINATKIMQAGAAMVKFEGGRYLCETVEYLTTRGIPVCCHLGLTPQTVHSLGGHKIQGRESSQAETILEDALQLQQAGASLLVLECVPHELSKQISTTLDIPVIGIGAGPDCDGQVLVLYDVLGLSQGKKLTFAKNYMQEHPSIAAAIEAYVGEVKQGIFPSMEHSFS